MKKQLLLTLLVSSQAMTGFQKDFFKEVRDMMDCLITADESSDAQRAEFLKQQESALSITLTENEEGVDVRIKNAQHSDQGNAHFENRNLIFKHPAFTALVAGFVNRNNDIYGLSAKINIQKTEDQEKEKVTTHVYYKQSQQERIYLTKSIDLEKASITFLTPEGVETEDAQRIGEYVIHFPHKEQRQVPITIQRTQSQTAAQ